MSTWCKAVLAAFCCGFLATMVGTELQMQLITSVYRSDFFTQKDFFSGYVCGLLGALSAFTWVYWRAKKVGMAASCGLLGGLGILVWLAVDRNSMASYRHLANVSSFEYWNSNHTPYLDFMGNALIYDGLALVWALLLAWRGVAMLLAWNKPAKEARTSNTQLLTD